MGVTICSNKNYYVLGYCSLINFGYMNFCWMWIMNIGIFARWMQNETLTNCTHEMWSTPNTIGKFLLQFYKTWQWKWTRILVACFKFKHCEESNPSKTLLYVHHLVNHVEQGLSFNLLAKGGWTPSTFEFPQP
jgi:hypothetical protein